MPKNKRANKFKSDGWALKRRVGSRGDPKKVLLIVCEGAKTEPNYFTAFRLTNVKVNIVGEGFSTMSLVKRAKELSDNFKKEKGIKYDGVWCVFDKDDFTDNDFNNAIHLAETYKFKSAHSNESFELWYLLHFCYNDTALSRHQYITRLSKHLGFRYKKNSHDMYELLLERQDVAINNAKRLADAHSNNITPAQSNPLTKVYELVEYLNSLMNPQSLMKDAP